MRYLLDTTVLIDVSHHVEPVSSQVREWLDGPDEVGVCDVNVAEFFSGLKSDERSFWQPFIYELRYWPIAREVAVQAGVYRYSLGREGRTISVPDALVAAAAFHVGATLVTNNVKDYPMPRLTVFRLGAAW